MRLPAHEAFEQGEFSMHRRQFLTTAGALPLVFSSAGASACTGIAAAEPRTDPTTTFGPWIEVNRAYLTATVEQVSRRVAGRPILAVVKGDAYGHGLTGTARHLERLPAIHGGEPGQKTLQRQPAAAQLAEEILLSAVSGWSSFDSLGRANLPYDRLSCCNGNLTLVADWAGGAFRGNL